MTNELMISVQNACTIDLELFHTISDEVYKVIPSVGNYRYLVEVFDTMNTDIDFFLCLYIYL